MILVVESDPRAADLIATQLHADGFTVGIARTAQHARVLAGAHAISLALLGNVDCARGPLQLLEAMRDASDDACRVLREVPAIVIGARGDELGMLRAFEAGADDYVARPASYLELRARLRAVLRRSAARSSYAVLRVDALEIDRDARRVTIAREPVLLRPLEFELLSHLATEPGRVFGRGELLRSIWGGGSGSGRTLDSHASRLRRKLDPGRPGSWIINVRGIGYRLR